MSITFEPLTADHWLAFGPNVSIKGDYYDPNWRETWVTPGTSWAMMDSGAPVALGGVMTRLPQVGYCWAAFAPDIGPVRLRRAAKWCKQEIGVLMSGRFNRLEAVVRREYGKGVQFAELLDFDLEGVARKWDGENDYFVYARIV